jgi:hypothetical protein
VPTPRFHNRVAEVALFQIRGAPRRAHAASETAARGKARDMDEDGIDAAQYDDRLRRQSGVGLGGGDGESEGRAEGQEHGQDGEGAEGADDNRPPFKIAATRKLGRRCGPRSWRSTCIQSISGGA